MYEYIESITLTKGQILIFFGWVPHFGAAGTNLKNRRVHVYLPHIKNDDVAENQVFVVGAENSVGASHFKKVANVNE